MFYNFPVLSGVYCTTQKGMENQAFLSWCAAALLYPLNTLKVQSQVSASDLSLVNLLKEEHRLTIRNGYRGVVPYLAINALVGWTLRPLFSQDKLE